MNSSSTAFAAAAQRPLPLITPLEAPFWEAARMQRLSVHCCGDCGDVRFPASPVCPRCLSRNQVWEQASGTGTLQSWVDFHRAYWPAFAGKLPYTVCIVQLREGPLMVSNLVGGLEGAAVGAPVRAIFEPVTDEITLPMFKLVRA
jgi:uncharacterized OB-fold protein